MCQLLPGAENYTVSRALLAGHTAFREVAPDVALSCTPDAGVSREMLASLRAFWLYPISVELMDRSDAGGAAPGDAPIPSPALDDVLIEYQSILLRVAPGTPVDAAAARAPNLRPVLERALLPDDEPAWGAWGLFAAGVALDHHADRLPEPGRRPASDTGLAASGRDAFEVGRMLLFATAIEWLNDCTFGKSR